MSRPNVVLLLADQMRGQATGYAGDPNVETPYLDRLAKESVNMTNAVSNCPICTPYRASLMTGQYPLTHGLFLNDLCLPASEDSLGCTFARHGYDTAYIGKWHLDGHGRSNYIPAERRQGFDYWKVLECTHDYNQSWYYSGDSGEKRLWEGYDAYDQTADAVRWLSGRREESKPFFLMVSYGPPHNPYDTAPPEQKAMYRADSLVLRDNVAPELEAKARGDLVGYYAHISALDECVRRIDEALESNGLRDNTVFMFTSDHGDSMESHCDPDYPGVNKQRPYEESIIVPLLIRGPGLRPRDESTLIAGVDLMPTLLGLCNLPIPAAVEGTSYAPLLHGEAAISREAVLVAGYAPFADWCLERGGRAYRGIRTERYTYVRDLSGPWLLFDNRRDPYQLRNLADDESSTGLRTELEQLLAEELTRRDDRFLPPSELLQQWAYEVDERGCVPYTN